MRLRRRILLLPDAIAHFDHVLQAVLVVVMQREQNDVREPLVLRADLFFCNVMSCTCSLIWCCEVVVVP